MKYCKHCNTKNIEEAKFCRKCGKSFSKIKFLQILFFAIPFFTVGIVYVLFSNEPIQQPPDDSSILNIDTTRSVSEVSNILVDSTNIIKENQKENVEEKTFCKQNWAGTYSASSYMGRTYGGTGIVYGIDIVLQNDGEDYSGTIEVNGYQCYTKYNITANSPIKNHLTIYVESHNDGMELFDQGDTLCELIYLNDGKLTADWFRAMEGFVNEETKISD